MGRVILVTGGARSGKSRFAEQLAAMGKQVGYIATAVATDDDMASRIAYHKASRPDAWTTFEIYRDFEQLALDERFVRCDTLLLDCLTTLTANHMVDSGLDFDTCPLDEVTVLETAIFEHVNTLLKVAQNKRLILVTNEVGQGLVPPYRMGSLFRDIAGRLNMHVAACADEAYCMIAGLPMRLK